jgi:hypothetical protein
MFRTPCKTLCSVLATAVVLGATAAPDALAQPIDARTPDTREAAERHPIIASGPPSWPVSPRPISRPHVVVDAPASGLDWDSAGIGAAAAAAAFAMAVAAIVGLRRRRFARIGSLTGH